MFFARSVSRARRAAASAILRARSLSRARRTFVSAMLRGRDRAYLSSSIRSSSSSLRSLVVISAVRFGMAFIVPALVLPGEEVALPDVREPVTAGGLADPLLERVLGADRVCLVGRRLAASGTGR